MAEISFSEVTKFYGDECAVSQLNLKVRDGEFMVLVGPSGCGKTTALRMVAGLEDLTAGEIRIGDRVINDVPPGSRDVAMVFQNYALYPHMTVAQNIGFGLSIRKVNKRELAHRVQAVADVLGLTEFLDRKPGALSGGQRQRVAMGRAIIRQPQAFLMDEPLSNLDAKLRVQMRAEIARIQRDLNVTTIYVTHDQTEAMTMGDRVAVMKRSLLQQVASPEALYERPANLFVAGFIGSPAMNLVEATLRRRNGSLRLEFGEHELALQDAVLNKHRALNDFVDRSVILGVRPESMQDAVLENGVDESQRLRVTVDLREALGSDVLIHFRLAAPPVLTEDTRELARDTDPGLNEAHGAPTTIFVARVSPSSRLREGSSGELVIDQRALHFFEPETGASIAGEL